MTLFMPSERYDSFQGDIASSQAEGDYQDHLAGLQAVKEAHDSYFRQAGAIMSGQPTDDTDMTAGGEAVPSPSPASTPAPLTPSTPAVSPAPPDAGYQAPTNPVSAAVNNQTDLPASVPSSNAAPASSGGLPYSDVVSQYTPDDLKGDPDFMRTVMAGAHAESNGDPNRVQNGYTLGSGQGARGFWQFDMGGMGKPYVGNEQALLGDSGVRLQASQIVPLYAAAYRNAPAGLTGAEKASWVAAQAERPKDFQDPSSVARRNYAAAYDSLGTTPSAPTAPTTIPAGPQGLPVQSPAASADATVTRPSQFGVGLSYADAMAACGPVAAVALANKYGSGNIPAQAVVDAARSSGLWDAQNGMHGVAAEQQLLQKEGVATKLETNVDWDHVRSDVTNGNPVIVSTPGHYFVIDKIDPETGLFHVGTSGTDLKAGTEYMTPERMQQLEGAASGALYVDNPQAHGPSVAEHPQNLIDQANQTFQSAVGAATGTAGQAKDTAASVLQQAEDEFQKRASDLGNSQLARNLTGTNPNQAELDAQSQLAHQQTQAATGADVRLPSGPGDLLNAGLGEPTGGEALASQRNEAIAANNPLRDVPVLGGATTFAGQAALDPTNLLLAGEPGVAGAAGSAAREGAGAVADVATSPAVQSALRSRLPAEAESGFAMGLPTGGDAAAAKAAAGDALSNSAGLATSPGPDRVPLSPAEVDAHIQNLQDAYTQTGERIEDIEARLLRPAGANIDRPSWARGKTDQELLGIADAAGVNAYEPLWWEKANLAPGTGEYQRAVLESGSRGVGSAQFTGQTSSPTQMRAQLSSLRAQQDGIMQAVEAIDQAGPDTTFYRVQQPPETELPFDAGTTSPTDAAAAAHPADAAAASGDAGAESPVRGADGGEGLAGSPTPAGAPAPVNGQVAARAGNIQLDKFPAEVQPVIQAAADANPEGLEAARRGVLPDAVVKDLSQQTNLNVGELVQKWTPGQAFNAETLVATRDALDEQANRVLDAQQALRAAPDSIDAQTQMLNALSMHGQLQEVVTGATAEAGRALRATGSNVTGGGVAVQRLQDWASMTGLTPDQVVEYLKTADLNNPSTLAQLAQGARRAADYLPPDEYLPSGPQAGQQGLDMFGEGPYTYSGPRPTGTEPLAEGVQPGQARLPNFPNPNPASPQQQFRAYYVGNVVSSVPTLSKVATNAIINPTWQLGRHLIFDPASHPEALGPTITGYFRGLADAGGAALNVIANGVDAQAAAGLGSKAYQSVSSNVDNPLISKVLAASEFAPRLHAAAQQFTQVAVQRMELGRQAAIQAASEGLHGDQWAQRVDDLIAHPAPGMLTSANDVAQRAALRGDLGTINSQFQKISQVPYAGTFLLPVVKIAANTLSGAVERSPLGLAGTAFDVARAKVGAGPYAGDVSKAVTPLGERFQNNLMGSAITAFLYGKAMEGAITGDGPSNPTQRQELMQNGWAPNSVYIPGAGYRDYHALGVLAGPLATIGNVADTIKYDEPKDPQSLMAGTVQRMARFMADDSSLRSLGEVYNILTGRQAGGVEGAAASTIAGAAQGLIPAGAAVRSAALATDPTQRAAQKGDLLERTKEQAELGIPGLRQQIPPSRDLTGAPAPNPQYGAGILLPRGANTALPVPPQHAGEPVKYIGVKDPAMQAVIDGAIRRVNAWERDPTAAPRPSATDRQLENRYGGNTNPAWQAWRQRQASGQQKADARVLQFAPQPR